jgi:hypothetical protein
MRFTSPSDIRLAAWWPEFLAVKDSMGWGALSKRFRVPEAVLRRAVLEAGVSKAPGKPGRKPRSGLPSSSDGAAIPSPRAAVDPVEAFAAELGRVPDSAIADKAGVGRWQVARFRAQRGIPAYDGYRFTGKPRAEGAPPPKPAPPAPKPASAAAPRPSDGPAPAALAAETLSAYAVSCSRGERVVRFVVLAGDVVDASRRALRVANARADGPWSVQSVQWVGEVAS